MDPDLCIFCNQEATDQKHCNTLGPKGVNGINAASTSRGSDIKAEIGQKVHKSCRERFINQVDIQLQKKKESDEIPVKRKRSARAIEGTFDSKTDCLFCGIKIDFEKVEHSYVKTDTFAKTISECCASRGDDWSFIIKGRIEYFGGDLHAADCVYHHSCCTNFRINRNKPLQYEATTQSGSSHSKRRKSGRPKDQEQDQAFEQMCHYLEQNDEEQLTLSDLRAKMKEFLVNPAADSYSSYYLKGQLQKRYGDSIYIAEGEGLQYIVTMKEKTSQILRSYFKTNMQAEDEECQKRMIIDTASRLIKSDVKTNVESVTDQYPSTDSLKLTAALDYLPETLRLLLSNLFVGKDTNRKVASIGQAIVQAIRPRAVVAPVQLGLAVQGHHMYRSRFLIDSLHEMGFCSSYGEVQRFERNAANSVAPDSVISETTDLLGMMLQFAADNVDHNLLTLDGKGTFHGMGIIAAMTPGQKVTRTIPREVISRIHLTEKTKIPIIDYRFANKTRRDIVFQVLPPLPDCDKRIDILWELSCSFKENLPNWQGMMHIIHRDNEHPGKSSVVYLPMIDMYSGDKTCILSTLEFVYNIAFKHHVAPVITFDQPLYWKAAEIIANAPQNSHLKSVVLMLGCFHTFMNVLGAVGTLMAGTGLNTILEEIYGENAVLHMMTGKSVQRAFRGHLLVNKCLNEMIISEVVKEQPGLSLVVDEAEEMYTSLVNGETTLDATATSDTLSSFADAVEKMKTQLASLSKTSQLWLNYQTMIQVAMSLIKADRTGSWQMHLRAVSDCLPIFAAAGHFNYLKTAYHYVQEMNQLQSRNPNLFAKFEHGCRVIRRTDQFWAGLSADLVIEQSLMRSLKTPGGLTRGSGMTEEQRALWTMSTPITSEYNYAMQEYTDLAYTTSEQHKEATQSRIKRDATDLLKLKTKLANYPPFSDDATLRNVVNGVVADDDVNVHDFKSVAERIIDTMIGQPVFSISFKRKDKAKTLGTTASVKVAADRTIDPGLLFQRFLVVSKTGSLPLQDVMEYELSAFPPALFDAKKVLRKPDKPQLAHAIAAHANRRPTPEEVENQETAGSQEKTPPETEHYVLDGGSLLQRLPWNRGETYGSIAKSYADFTIRHYSKATVVFDGYLDGPAIKDNTHQRRGKNVQPVVSFNQDTIFSGKKEDFLSRDCNKQKMIDLISQTLRDEGCEVNNAPGDADVEIVKAAVQSAVTRSTTLIGEDTDLLLLLLFYAKATEKDLYFRSDKGNACVPYHINALQAFLGDQLCSQLLFIHAYTGCDSTSRIFGVGKKTVFQKLVRGDATLKACANAFVQPKQTAAVIEGKGCQAMAVIYGGKTTDSLASLRYRTFSKKVVSSQSFVTPERLPPTAAATKYHSMRVYYQVMVWIGQDNDMDACDWGWKLEGGQLVPIESDMNAAPDNLLKMIHCNCTTACSSQRCSCRGYSMPCTPACGPCQLDTCDNPHNQTLAEENDDDEDDPK